MGKQREGMSWKSITAEIDASGAAPAASALPPAKPQGSCERSRLATGSLPVLRGLYKWLTRRMQMAIRCEKNAAKRGDYVGALRFEYEHSALIPVWTKLRAEIERASVRQPEENVRDEPRHE